MATRFDCPCALQSFFCCFCCNEEDDSSTISDLRPLLGTPPPGDFPMPPQLRTYGSKRSTAAAGASAIFGQSAPPSPAADLVSAIDSLVLSDSEEDYTLEEASIIKPYGTLLPLVTAYKSDIGRPMTVKGWNDILDDDADLEKIAEASYAEVYRVTTEAGSSILKVMRIKLPELPDSMDIETAIDVNILISELRIMNALTTVPGFVTFKDAHLVQGMVPRCIRRAFARHEDHLKELELESYFPSPPSDDTEAWFLVVELGDAGQVLDECELDSVEKFWDVFIGVAIALARAEIINDFEHRDLHENNICIKLDPDKSLAQKRNPKEPLRYGFSGLEVTIIDYGLSRCRVTNGNIAANDLEQDLCLFKSVGSGIAGLQYDTYRRMRTHLIEGTRVMRAKEWHTEESFQIGKHPCSWTDYIPYTNVLWLRYLFSMLLRKLKKDCPTATVSNIEVEAKELKRRFDTRTKVENGGFSTAEDVLTWMLQAGWVTEEQIAGDTTSLSEG